MARIFSLLVLGGIVALSVAGCSRGPQYGKLEPARGRVTLEGKPVTGYDVCFVPDSSKGNTTPQSINSMCVLDANGAFEMRTRDSAGIPAGWYKVAVELPLNPATPPTPKNLPTKYQDPTSSPLSVEVPPGGSTTIELKLDSK